MMTGDRNRFAYRICPATYSLATVAVPNRKERATVPPGVRAFTGVGLLYLASVPNPANFRAHESIDRPRTRMQIEFAGAAREVTGSCHILRINGKTVLLDCGMFQGRRSDTREKNLALPCPV